MPRPTLKIPAKAASTDAEGEVRAPSHKPARAGFKAPKQSVAQRASSNAAKAARLLLPQRSHTRHKRRNKPASGYVSRRVLLKTHRVYRPTRRNRQRPTHAETWKQRSHVKHTHRNAPSPTRNAASPAAPAHAPCRRPARMANIRPAGKPGSRRRYRRPQHAERRVRHRASTASAPRQAHLARPAQTTKGAAMQHPGKHDHGRPTSRNCRR